MNALQEIRDRLFGGRANISILELAVVHASGITVAEHEQAAADLARITAENVELKRLLIEQVGEHGWTNGGDYPDYCRTCENTAKQGHKADCRLDAVLK